MKFPSIEKYKELQKTRWRDCYWHLNLIECEKMCQSEQELKHFMCYVHNPFHYSYEIVEDPNYRTLEDTIRDGKLQKIEPMPKGFVTKMYKNGNEITIVDEYKPDPMDIDEGDEKSL